MNRLPRPALSLLLLPVLLPSPPADVRLLSTSTRLVLLLLLLLLPSLLLGPTAAGGADCLQPLLPQLPCWIGVT